MKKGLVLNLIYLLAFSGLIIVFKNWFSIEQALPFVLGALVGTFLPYLDYLIYAYVIKPGVPTLGEVKLNSSSVLATVKQYYTDRSAASDLIMHTALFQAALAIFLIFIFTSSGSMLARGIVLSMSLHLILDQVKQYLDTNNLDSWFSKFPIPLDANQQKFFMAANVLILIIFTVVL